MDKEGKKVDHLEKEIERLRQEYRKTTKGTERFSINSRIKKFREQIKSILKTEQLAI